MEDLQPGQAAFLTGKFMRKSKGAIKRSLMVEERNCTGIIINQWRYKIGVMKGDPRTTPGGKAKDFACFIRAEVQRAEWIENTRGKRIGQVLRIKNIKNKTAPSGAEGFVDYYYADGNGHTAGTFDTLKESIDVGIETGVIVRGGSYYRFAGQQWKGREALVNGILADPLLQEQIAVEVLQTLYQSLTDIRQTDETGDGAGEQAPPAAPARTRKKP